MKLNISSLISYFIPFLIILSQYKLIGNVSYGILIIVIFTFLIVISDRFTLYFNKLMLALIISMLVSTFLMFFRSQEFHQAQLNYLIMGLAHVIVISTCVRYVNFNIIYKSYKFVGLVSIIILIYQSFIIYVLGQSIAPISILPIADSDIRLWQPALRPSAIFTEPQAFCSFMLPLLIFARSKNDNLLSILIIISVILSGSSFGILSLLFLFAFFFFSKNTSNKNKLSVMFILLPLAVVLVSSSFMDSAIDKILNIDVTNQIRISKGFEIYSDMNFTEKLLGLDISVEAYVKNDISKYPWAFNYINSDVEHLLNYVTTFSGVFVSYGLIPGILFSILLFLNHYNSIGMAKQMSLLIILMSFTATLLFNVWFVFYYILYYAMKLDSSDKDFVKVKFLGK